MILDIVGYTLMTLVGVSFLVVLLLPMIFCLYYYRKGEDD